MNILNSAKMKYFKRPHICRSSWRTLIKAAKEDKKIFSQSSWLSTNRFFFQFYPGRARNNDNSCCVSPCDRAFLHYESNKRGQRIVCGMFISVSRLRLAPRFSLFSRVTRKKAREEKSPRARGRESAKKRNSLLAFSRLARKHQSDVRWIKSKSLGTVYMNWGKHRHNGKHIELDLPSDWSKHRSNQVVHSKIHSVTSEANGNFESLNDQGSGLLTFA